MLTMQAKFHHIDKNMFFPMLEANGLMLVPYSGCFWDKFIKEFC